MAQPRLSLLSIHLGVSFCACLAAVLLLAGPAIAEAVLSQVSGAVEIGRGEPTQWSVAHAGEAVAPNDRVRTGADGRVEIKMNAGTLRVHENSMLRLPPAVPETDRVELESGRSLFDVLRRGDRRFEVHTPTVVVSVKGTRFGVDAGMDIGEVTVYRGTVGVREAGPSNMMETLVREGFLATGGGGIPIELEVSTAADPWQDWQEFDRAAHEERKVPTRVGEMERAKAALHKATEADVIVKAAERRPEVAKRLEELQKAQRGGSDGKAGRLDTSMPAAPDLGGERASDIEKGILLEGLGSEVQSVVADDLQLQSLEMIQVFDAERVELELELNTNLNLQDLMGGGSVNSAVVKPAYGALYEMSPEALVVVRSTLMVLQSDYTAGIYAPTSPADLVNELESALLFEGFTNLEATKAVQTLLGN